MDEIQKIREDVDEIKATADRLEVMMEQLTERAALEGRLDRVEETMGRLRLKMRRILEHLEAQGGPA